MKKKKFVIGLASLALMLGAAGVVGGSYSHFGGDAVMTRAADDVVVQDITLTFPDDNKTENGVSGYDSPWTAKTGSYEFTISNFNNNNWNNSWKLIKCGSKTTASVASIATSAAIPFAISEITVNFDSVKASGVNAIYLVTSTNGETYDDSTKVSLDKTSWKSGDQTFSIASPSANLYYKLVFDCNKSVASNGFVVINSLTMKAVSTTPEISVVGGNDIALKKNETKGFDLSSANIPSDATYSVAVTDEGVATASLVDGKLSVTGVSLGETDYTITVKDNTDAEIATCTGAIVVSIDPTSVTINAPFEDGASLRIGTTYDLTATVAPEGVSQSVVWSISNTNAATIDDGKLTIVAKISDDPITVTAASAVDSTITKTINFVVSNTFKISELVSSDGVKYPTGLKENDLVSTSGTVTAIEGKCAYIQSGDAAVQLYTKGDELSALKIGDYVNATGSLTIYNGVTELTSPSATVDTSKSETITPLEATASDMVSANTNRLMTVKGAKCTESKTVSGTKNLTIGFTLADGTTSFVVYIKSAEIENASAYGNFVKDICYDITGIFANYSNKNKQIIIDQGCSFAPVDKDKLDAFVADYITKYAGEAKEGETCKAKYENAKAAYDALSDNAKALFATADYAEAKKIYDYWNEHQNDSNGVGFATSSSTNWTAIGAIVVGLLVAGAATYMFIRSRKRKEND